jgi:dTMP kinase
MKLIAIEGVDGAGTTTQTRRLAEHFGLYQTREPSDGTIGRFLRRILRGEEGPVDETAVALLFAADRVEHVRHEINAQTLDAITDRYVLSSIVYQSLNLDRDFVVTINRHARPADLTILVDVDVEVAAQRRAERGGPQERYDDLKTQTLLVDAYRREIQRLPDNSGIIVDGSGPADQVFTLLAERVRSCLDRR